ncbi:conserved protein of unknown function [Ectopseudomonas oleovorans]|uniref:Uncharacterized protein n=1 Tax=Ectopseudomonas oleovorans TaxID=301 RepID=A0A653BA61_ECTOL|nr:conserved protein of unknown function [Pseudomonas oleovorans]
MAPGGAGNLAPLERMNHASRQLSLWRGEVPHRRAHQVRDPLPLQPVPQGARCGLRQLRQRAT